MMSIGNIRPAVSDMIDAIASREDADVVKRAVSGYTMPDSITGKVAWVAYRIFNAFKSIFGMSDWQLANRALSENTFRRASRGGQIPLPEERLRSLSNELAELALDMFLVLNRASDPSEMVDISNRFETQMTAIERRYLS